MTVVAGFDPTEIRLSDNAVSKLQHLIEDEDNPSLRFRVYITGGGCSGFNTALPSMKIWRRMTGSLSERVWRH